MNNTITGSSLSVDSDADRGQHEQRRSAGGSTATDAHRERRSLSRAALAAFVTACVALCFAALMPACIVQTAPGYQRGCTRYWVAGYCRFGRCYPGRWMCR